MSTESAHERVARVVATHTSPDRYETLLAGLKERFPTERALEEFVPVIRELWQTLTGKTMSDDVWLALAGYRPH